MNASGLPEGESQLNFMQIDVTIGVGTFPPSREHEIPIRAHNSKDSMATSQTCEHVPKVIQDLQT